MSNAEPNEPIEPVQPRDFVLVGLYVAVLYAIVLCVGGPLTMHEGVLSQTTKAMLGNHDWLVPRYGDAPWLERPPLPQWISCAICVLIGHCDEEWNIRIGPALAGLLTSLLTVWLAGRLFGRTVAIVSGLMLATMYNFLRYSTLAEADIFLAPIIAGVLGAFAYTEILRKPALTPDPSPGVPGEGREIESINFFGTRPWPVLLFFVLLGMTNLVKGLVFGTVIALAPVGVFLLWNFRWRSIARYCWLWGWLAFFAVALPWPLLAAQRYPDAVEVWKFDLFGRLNSGYLAEPWWYYFVCLFWVPQPWSFLAFIGLGLTFKKAFKEGSPNHRFVWCWAWMPLLVFSLSQGKHHHYMLHYLAPWAILAAHGAVWCWSKVQMPAFKRSPSIAVAGCFAVIFAMFAGFFTYKGAYLNRSIEDTAFLREVRRKIPLDQPLMINSADEALEGLRMQFYIGETVYFLHNLSYVRDDRIDGSDIYVVTRKNRLAELEKYGQVEMMLVCEKSRRERDENDRWTLFHIRLRDDLERKSARVRITPMQAMYREPGPDLDKR